MSHMLGETLNAVHLSRPVVGDNVLIIGAGAVGISLLALLKCTFADKVIVADILTTSWPSPNRSEPTQSCVPMTQTFRTRFWNSPADAASTRFLRRSAVRRPPQPGL